jgi:hypothetical protein
MSSRQTVREKLGAKDRPARGDWQSLPRPVVECIQVQGVRVAKESGFD